MFMMTMMMMNFTGRKMFEYGIKTFYSEENL